MAISIDWGTRVIFVPKDFLTPLGGVLYGLNVDNLRVALKSLEDDEDGMVFPDTHRHSLPLTLAGVTYARGVEIINGYTVEFEDGQYTVVCSGANHNLSDVKVPNSVSLVIGNAAGLIVHSVGSGLSSEEHDWLLRCLKSSEIKRCTVQDDGASTTKFNTDLTEDVNGFWDRAGILFATGQCQGQIRGVKTYKQVNGELTLETPLSYQPERGDEMVMIASRKYLAPDMDRVLGLVQQNFRMRDQLYDDDNNLTSARVRLYANASDALADLSPIAEYLMNATFSGPGVCTGYVMREA